MRVMKTLVATCAVAMLLGSGVYAGTDLNEVGAFLVFPTIVAVPLGIQPLRAGRSAGALTAIGVVGAYWLLSSVGEMAADEGFVSPAVGMWMPNVIVLLIGLGLVRRSMRVDA